MAKKKTSAKKTMKKATKKTSTKKTTKKVSAKTSVKKSAQTTSKKNKKAKKTAKSTKKTKRSITEIMLDILRKRAGRHNPIQAELLGEEVNTEDPSKAPGHRHLDIKSQSGANPADGNHSETARKNLTRADKVNRNSSAQRRIITGAAVGKTGRIVSK